MADPVGDDVGDGDYAYPSARFREGVFELTGFEVFKDSVMSISGGGARRL